MEIIALLIGIAIGSGVVWIINSYKKSSNQTKEKAESMIQENTISSLQKELEESKLSLEEERREVLSLNNTLATTESNNRHLQEKLSDQKKELTQLQEKFTTEFKNIANDILEEKSKKFTDQNKVNLGEILIPLKEKITSFEQKVEQNNKDGLQRHTALSEQLKGLKELNQQMSKEATNLTNALKGDSKTQGNWGEVILERVLEISGLEKGREYEVQSSITDQDGKRYLPDVIIHLPDDKHIIIDSKVSLVAYERSVSAELPEDKEANLKLHIQSLRNHIKGLSEKSYQKLHGLEGLDFVLLFVPIEPAFGLAITHDNELFAYAFERNIVIVSPSTLLATLRIISNIWNTEKANRNAQEIKEQCIKLYDKFVGLTDDLIKVGNSLKSTQSNYQNAMIKLSEGKGNLVSKVENIKKLGATSQKTIDQNLLDRSEKM